MSGLPLALIVLLAAQIGPDVSRGAFSRQHGYVPRAGYVPNEAAAVAVARAVLTPIYGERTIRAEEPLQATRKGAIWTVKGTLKCGLSWWERLWAVPCIGGTATVALSAKDGSIIYVDHGQ